MIWETRHQNFITLVEKYQSMPYSHLIKLYAHVLQIFFNTIVKMINVTEEKGEDFRCNFLVFLNHAADYDWKRETRQEMLRADCGWGK